MRVLVACEYSRAVASAFEARGHFALSCDLLRADVRGRHLQGDVAVLLQRDGVEYASDRARKELSSILTDSWDLMVCHPPCTYLTSSAEWAYKDGPYHQKVKEGTLVGAARREARKEAVEFCRFLLGAPVPRICLENPRGHLSSAIRKPDQIVQPYQFGDDASKATCFWLVGLEPLRHTKLVPPRITKDGKNRWSNQTDTGQNKLPPTADRWKIRSETYPGIAAAMAEQWG